jgi:L-alanine-DL-glutamate epimerase-like enolase superfamily enzyme
MKNNNMGTNRRNFLASLGLASLSGAVMANPFNSSLFENDVDLAKSGIKITGLKTYILPRALFVKIETNAGVTGWGESSPNNRHMVQALIETDFKKLIIGRDPFDVEAIWDTLYWGRHDLGPAGALTYAVAGVDLALWDIKGKLLNQPVYKLLGGCYRKEFPTYGGIPLKGGNVPVEEAIKRALRLAEKGFKTVKLRMQIREYNLNPIPDPTIKYYTAVRKALPDNVDLFVDPNEGYTASRAIQVGKELQAMGMKYYEGPCPLENYKDTAAVVEAIDIPVLAGEKCYTRWQFRDLILLANPDIIQPDIIKSGGITEVKKIAVLGQTFFKTLAPHNTKPTLGTAAALHLLASCSNFGPFIEFIEPELYTDIMSVCENQVEFKNGNLILPEQPGLGLTVIEKMVDKLAE